MAGHGYPCQNIWQLTKTCYARRQRRPARHSGAGRQTNGPDGWTDDARQAGRQSGGHIILSHSSISLGSPKFKLIPSLALLLSLSLPLSHSLVSCSHACRSSGRRTERLFHHGRRLWQPLKPAEPWNMWPDIDDDASRPAARNSRVSDWILNVSWVSLFQNSCWIFSNYWTEGLQLFLI